jgi:hypothetical protein
MFILSDPSGDAALADYYREVNAEQGLLLSTPPSGLYGIPVFSRA